MSGKGARVSGPALRERLRLVSERTGGPKHGVAILAEEFFASPGLRTFEALCKAAQA